MEISKQIKNYRILNDLTQKDLGILLNVSDKTISSWETGRTYPDISLIIALSEIFHLSLDEFLKGDTSMVQKIDRDLKMKQVYKYSLLIGSLILVGVIIFFTVYQFKNQWIDRFNPFMKMQIGYATLPTEVTYNGGKKYNETSQTSNIPDPYKDIVVVDSPFGDSTLLTFSGGQSPKNKNYAMVEHKGLYVKTIAFISWDSIPLLYRENMSPEYVAFEKSYLNTNRFKQILTD